MSNKPKSKSVVPPILKKLAEFSAIDDDDSSDDVMSNGEKDNESVEEEEEESIDDEENLDEDEGENAEENADENIEENADENADENAEDGVDEDDNYDIETGKNNLAKGMKSCIYKKNSDQSKSEDSGDDLHPFEFEEEDIQPKTTNRVPHDQRTTKAILTKYERVRLLSDRTTQLTRGAKPLVKNVESLTSKQIAELELKHDVIPLKIKRPLPDNTYEIWWTKELLHDRDL